MSKRQLAHSGWVDFTGLRFAEKFATRQELIQAVRGFFNSRGLHFRELKVEFRVTRNPRQVEDGNLITKAGDMYYPPYCYLRIRVFVRLHGSRRSFFETLFHELDHVAWWLEGKSFRHDLPYRQRPHEIRAYGMEFKEAERFLALVGRELPR